MRKEKEKIKTQIIKSLEVYKGKPRFNFFDSSDSNTRLNNVALDDNDLEVLLMDLGNSNWILLTTKCLFVRQNGIDNRINGIEIEDFKFLNLENGRNKEKAAEFKNPREYKSWLYSGDFKIIKKDNTEIIVNLPHHDFGFCLFNAIKKLRFVTNKYEGI
ncbi:hypothetical protein BTO06_01200 [Tenacibaculum sp. SZ-18]|uniref:hypothetical protein n=1 Tax=Tenacibaculum sp. SZ-18 TaxID=754423 RepID=UPI000C2D0A35|nr:hypothetical protein [Tenacibaculum sp. SZ-18]AUC13851.1 hypothetical protein BTO06_01200 [Tenacibaculum sp. SZ-18]